MAGLPRSGSTVLSALLNQHPEVYASPQTDLLGIIHKIESSLPFSEQHNAGLLLSSYKSVLSGITNLFYEPIAKPVIIDKNRGWGTPYNLNMIKPYVSHNGKFIITVRPILEVLASFTKLAKRNNKLNQSTPFLNQELWVADYREQYDALADSLMVPNGEIDRAIYSIYNLLKTNQKNCHLVWFDKLTKNPQDTMTSIYNFLGVPLFDNNFDQIKEVDAHNDLAGYGAIGLHEINKQLKDPKTNPTDYLSNYVIDKYKNALDFLWE